MASVIIRSHRAKVKLCLASLIAKGFTAREVSLNFEAAFDIACEQAVEDAVLGGLQ